MKYIGIDIGSSFVKAVLLDLDERRMVSSVKSPAPQKIRYEDPLLFEVPAGEYVKTVKGLVDGFTGQYSDTEGLIISTQMHGFVYHAEGFEDRYVSWQDERCMEKMPGQNLSWLEWMQSWISPEEMEEHGVYLKPSLGVCNLCVMLEQNPDMPRNGEFFTIGSYVIHALTGNNICHISNAAPAGLADVRHHRWSRKMTTRMNLGDMTLPRLVESDYEVCGTFESNGCMLKVHPDYGDMQVSALGSDIGVGDALVNIATGAQVIRCADRFETGKYEIRPFFGDRYLYTISNMPAGRNLNVLVDFIAECAGALTGSEPDPQLVWRYVHAHQGQPDERLDVRTSFYINPYFPDGGVISGITHTNLHMETLFPAAFRDMAETYWRFIGDFGENRDWVKRIVMSGGVSWKTPEIRENLEKVSGRMCVLSPIEDEALAGMFRLAMVCSGKAVSLSDAGSLMTD